MFTLGVRLGILFFSFAASVITARFLGPSGRGAYFFVLSITAIVAQFANLGMHAANTYFVAKDHTLRTSLLINSLWVSLVVGGIGALVAFIFVNVLISHHVSMIDLLPMFLLVPATVFFMLVSNLFIGLEQIKRYNFFQLAGNIIVSGLLIITGIIAPTAMTFLLAMVVGWVLTDIGMYFALTQNTTPTLKLNLSLLKTAAGVTSRAYILSLINFLNLKIGVLFVQAYQGNQELGYFSIASQINDGMIILPSTLGLLVLPRLVKDPDKSWQYFINNLVVTAFCMLPACFLAIWLVRPFVNVAFGKSFLPAAQILLYMLPGTFFYALASITASFLAAKEYPIGQIITWAIAFVIGVTLNSILVPLYGAIGAAVALSCSYSVAFIGLFFSSWVIQRKCFTGIAVT